MTGYHRLNMKLLSKKLTLFKTDDPVQAVVGIIVASVPLFLFNNASASGVKNVLMLSEVITPLTSLSFSSRVCFN